MLRLRKQPSPIAISASGAERQPAAGLEQRPLADPQPALVERLQHLALDRVADEEAAAGGVAVDPQAAQPAVVALVPAPLRPPEPPPRRARPRPELSRAPGSRVVSRVSPASDRLRGGIDLGGTKIQTVVVDAGGEVLGQSRRPTPTSGRPARTSPREMAAALREAAAEAGVETGDLAGVGVGSPGDADEKTGVVSGARNLPGWEGTFPLGETLKEALGTEVRIGNDVQVAIEAEFDLGAGREFKTPDRGLVGHRRRRRPDPRRQAVARPRRRRRDRPRGRQARRRALPLRAARLHGGLRGPRGDGDQGAPRAREGRTRPTSSS